MSSRILLATVAVIALTAPAAAQDQTKSLAAEKVTGRQLEQTPQAPKEQSGAKAEAAAPGGQAAEPTDTEKPPVTGKAQPAELAGEQEPTAPVQMQFLEVQEKTQFLADEEVIGKQVVNVRDEEVGTIDDLVMNHEQKLVGVVLSVGGFLGIGDKWVAIPVEQIEFPTADQPARLLVGVTEEQLKNAPDFVTREAVEAQEAVDQAQRQAMEQQQQIPSPSTTSQ